MINIITFVGPVMAFVKKKHLLPKNVESFKRLPYFYGLQ